MRYRSVAFAATLFFVGLGMVWSFLPSGEAHFSGRRISPAWRCKYRGILGYYENSSFLGWSLNDDPDQKGTFSNFKRLGAGWLVADYGQAHWFYFQKEPSWRGGKVILPREFVENRKRWKAAGLESWFTFSPGSPQGTTPEGRVHENGWTEHIYDSPVDREIRRSWDPSAPPGWSMVDEWRLFIREFIRATKVQGNLVDVWMVLTEPLRPDAFGERVRDAGLLIQAGVEEVKKADPSAFVAMEGVLGRRLHHLRALLANGAEGIQALGFRTLDRNMPEAAYLQDRTGKGTGLREGLTSWYALGRKWGIRDPLDGQTKVLITDMGVAQIRWTGEDNRSPSLRDTLLWREELANYWTRSVLLALSTNFVAAIKAKYREEEGFWAYAHPAIGIDSQGKELPSQAAALLLGRLLGEAIFISELSLGEGLYGLRFRDDRSREMATALWSPEGPREATLNPVAATLKAYQREGRKIGERSLKPGAGPLRVTLTENPLYLVGEIGEKEWARVDSLTHRGKAVKGEKEIFEIAYQADRELNGGEVVVRFPPGWIRPQTGDPLREGYTMVEPGPGVILGQPSTDGKAVRVPLVEMRNGHTFRLIYGDARQRSYLFDCGENEYGPISPDHEKIQGNMLYYPRAGSGFDHEGIPRSSSWESWEAGPGGIGVEGNSRHSIYRDMAASVNYPGWKFMVDADPRFDYQVRVYLRGESPFDQQLSEQKVRIGGQTHDSSRDRTFVAVRPEGKRIILQLIPDSVNSTRLVPDNTRICYLYGLDLIPQALGGGPTLDARLGENVFLVSSRSRDGRNGGIKVGFRVVE